MAKKRLPVLIVGAGNAGMCDMGFGIHVLRAIAADPPPGVALLAAGTDLFSHLAEISAAERLLLVDVIDHGGPPGSIAMLDGYDEETPLRAGPIHELSLVHLVSLLPVGSRPDSFCLLGVQPEDFRYGHNLSPRLQAALPHAVAMARRVVASWKALAVPA